MSINTLKYSQIQYSSEIYYKYIKIFKNTQIVPNTLKYIEIYYKCIGIYHKYTISTFEIH
jgi:hypothetical protein